MSEVDNFGELENGILQELESDDSELENSEPLEPMSEAIQKLQEHAKAIRKEAFAEGYQAAIRDMIREMNRFGANAQPLPSEPFDAKESAVKRERGSQTRKVKRAPHGQNRKFVFEMLRTVAPKGVTPMEVQTWIDENKGRRIAYASIRHALDQLEKLGNIRKSEDGSQWSTVIKLKPTISTTANGLSVSIEKET